ncbi:hypothetical protein Tco_1078147, partial [Tanacetum coccineum]
LRSQRSIQFGTHIMDLDSPNDDEPIIVQDESDEESQNHKLEKQNSKAEAEIDFLLAQPTFPNVQHLTKLLVKSLQPELSKILSTYDFSNSLPTELKELPSKFTKLTENSAQPEGKHIKKDKDKKAMSSKDAEEEGSESDPDDTIHLTGKDHVYLTKEQIKEQKRIEESTKAKAAKHEVEYDKYYDKMLNRRGKSRITNSSDLHLAEWKEAVQACPNRTGKGWTTIYENIKTRMDYLHQTEAELGINLNKHLSEQDPLDKLNNLAKKKRKNANDIHDYFKANKRLKTLLPLKTLDIYQMRCCTLYKNTYSDFIKVLSLMIMPGPSVPLCLLKLTRES